MTRAHATTEGTCPLRYLARHGWSTCDQPIQGGTICPACSSDFAARLRTIPELIRVLTDLVHGAETIPHGPGTHTPPGPRSPTCDDLIDLRDSLHVALREWADRLDEPHPRDLVDVAHWLADRHTHTRTRPWAPDMIHSLDKHITRIDRTINPPPAKIRVTCPECGNPVPIPTNTTNDTVITCHGHVTVDGVRTPCTAWGVLTWWADNAGVDRTPALLRHLPERLLAHGHHVDHRRVRDWRDRGLITPTSLDDHGRQLFDPTQAAAVAARITARTRHAKEPA